MDGWTHKDYKSKKGTNASQELAQKHFKENN
jgi:hypothetical protein